MANDKIPTTSFKLQATYACLNVFSQHILPAKHAHGTWKRAWTFSFMSARGMTLGKLLYPCEPMSLQAHSEVSFALLGRYCWKELCNCSAVPDPLYPLGKPAKAFSRKHPYSPPLSLNGSGNFLSFCKINPKFQHLRVLKKGNSREMLSAREIFLKKSIFLRKEKCWNLKLVFQILIIYYFYPVSLGSVQPQIVGLNQHWGTVILPQRDLSFLAAICDSSPASFQNGFPARLTIVKLFEKNWFYINQNENWWKFVSTY